MKRIFIFLLLITFSYEIVKAQTEVTFYTNQGNFIVELYDGSMPITTGNFKSLVNAKFYDGVIFHRVINNFMIQGGDPTGTGSGGPGYTIADEFVTGLSNIQKTISMANSGPNTGGSQFFINLVNNTYLDFDKAPLTSAHPVFGITTNNFSVVQTIGAVPTNASNRPLSDVVMDSLRITKTYPLSIQSQTQELGSIQIYPNPVNENSMIEININSKNHLELILMNQEGKILTRKALDWKSGKHIITLNDLYSNHLANGNYYIGLTDGTQFLHHKMMVQN